MKKNYYDILEVSKYASSEVIEKAYKTLVKKYHPDLQERIQKKEYEEKLKLLNEAYEILSDEEKRKQYNLELEQEDTISSQKGNIIQDNFSPNPNYNENRNLNVEQTHQNIDKMLKQARQQAEFEKQYNQKVDAAIKKAYHDAYIQDLKNRGYKIKYKKTFKDYLKNLLSFVIFIVLLIILWHIPFVKNFFINMYEENIIIHYIVDLLIKVFKS